MSLSSELLTTDEAADCLRIAKQTLARWRCEGGGPPYVKLGSKVLYPRDGITTFVGGRLIQATAQRHQAA